MMLNGTFLRTSILPNKLTLNTIEVKMTLSSKTVQKTFFAIVWLQEVAVIHLISGDNFMTY